MPQAASAAIPPSRPGPSAAASVDKSFARALAGSAEAGDALWQEARAAPSRRSGRSDRAALLLRDIAQLAKRRFPEGGPLPAEDPASRNASLLLDWCGAGEELAAAALGCTPDALPDRVAAGRRGIAGLALGGVLVVEDDAFQAMQLVRALKGGGYLVRGVAARAGDAAHLLARRLPDLVVCDLHLESRGDGAAFGLELARSGAAGLVFVTADPGALPDEAADLADIVPKPWHVDALARAAARAVIGQRLGAAA